MSRRRIRNEVMEEALKAGHAISYRSSGWSLWPRVVSGQVCTVIPVMFAEMVNEGDIVFCRVQETNEYYILKVLSIGWDRKRSKEYYWIGNNRGRKNGWCYLEHIFGKVVDIYDDRE